MNKVNLAEKFALFDDRWSPKLVGALDDYDIKLVKLEGEFVWHQHERDDELFLVVDGHLSMDFRDRTGVVNTGDAPAGALTRHTLDRI